MDVTIFKDGFYGDNSKMVTRGKVLPEVEKLIQVVEEATLEGIKKAVVGGRLCDIGNRIQEVADQNGLFVD